MDDKVVDDMSILNSMADMLVVDKPPIIWYGKLDDSQKTRLMEYLRAPEEQLEQKFKTTSFTKYIISILNPGMKKTALNNNVDKPIDSIIFKFIGSDKNEVYYAKAVDPIVQQMNKTNDDEREPQDMYGIILSDIVEFIKINGIKKYTIAKGSNDERFIELICSIYNDYIKKNGYKFEGVELDKQSFASTPKFDLNSGFIPNIQTRDFIVQSPINKNIFKIMVGAFSKLKKKPTGTLTQMLLDDVKEISDRIKEKIGETPEMKESSVLTFEEFLLRKEEKSRVIKD
jgi:hypothetical protein